MFVQYVHTMCQPVLGFQIVGNRTDEVLALTVFILVGKTEIAQSYNMMSDSRKEDKAR